MGAHAVRNASGSKRWMNCPGSLRLTDRLRAKGIKPSSSEFARLGTAAHGLCELSVKQRRHPSEWLGGSIFLDEHEDALVVGPVGSEESRAEALVRIDAKRMGWGEYPIDENMVDAVELYYTTVLDDLEEMGPGAELSVERRFNLNWLIGYDFDEEAWEKDHGYVSPSGITYVWDDELMGYVLRHADGTVCYGPMFGTNDASILQPFDLLRVYDYKHGQGVLVEVEDNSQELYYALGIAQEVDWCFDELELVIVQPRAPHEDGPVRRWRCSADRLRAFAEELRLAALACGDPEAPIAAGEWCGFCPAAAYCPALKERAFQTAQLDFAMVADVPVMTSLAETGPATDDEALRERMEAIPLLDAFIKAVEGETMRRLRETPGGEAFGHKLVRKKSNRKFREDLTVEAPDTGDEVPLNLVDHLTALGFPRDELYEPPKMKGPAKIEKLRPPALMAQLKADGVKAPASWIKAQVAELTFKPEGGITIAPSHDPRPAVDPSAAAASDFAVYEEEDADA